MTPTETAALVAVITALWPNAPAYRAEHIEAFHAVLGACDAVVVKQALVSISKEGGAFPPNAGQLYARVQAIVDPVPDWGAAWGEVISWVKTHGYVDPPTVDSFSHPAVYAAVQRIGYQELCQSEVTDAEVWLGHWRRIYGGSERDNALVIDREQLGPGPWSMGEVMKSIQTANPI